MTAALWEAVEKRTLKAFQAAIDGGADINAANPDDDDNTALLRIVKSKSGVMSKTEVAIAMWLIEKGADVTKANDIGETPLHMAAASGNLEVLEALVAKGATVTLTRYKATPLFYCLSTHDKNTKLWDRLLELGCGIEDRNESGDTPLLDAVSSHNPAAVKYLLAKGADKNVTDSKGLTPLDNAVKYKNEKLQKLLAK
ncbi:MAG TPA: ankyrin repeat domain-containing protein [Kofleriaceae bacterium]